MTQTTGSRSLPYQVLEQEIMDLLEAMEQDLDTKGGPDARM